MKEFLFVYRADYPSMPQGTPEEMKAITQKWMDWIMGLGTDGHLVDRGNRLCAGGKVVRPNHMTTDGPFVEIKELIGGYTVVKANTLEDAAALASGCPILEVGGNVEVREINPL